MQTISSLKDIESLVLSDKAMMEVLEIAMTLNLKDWWIGAGFIRNRIWDFAHGLTYSVYNQDIDIIYYDRDSVTKDSEHFLLTKLATANGSLNWSIKNQARMHLKNGDDEYLNSTDALSKWTETATSIGVKLNSQSELRFTYPHGFEDLLNLIVRPTRHIIDDIDVYYRRLEQKQWHKRWPKIHYVLTNFYGK